MTGTPRSSAKRSVLRRALPRTKNGIFRSSCSASADQVDGGAPCTASWAGARAVRQRHRRGGARWLGQRLLDRPSGAGTAAGRTAAEPRCEAPRLVELEVVAEHVQQVLFEAHHQRVHPGVEHHVRALEAHLRRVARREVLHVHRRRDHRAGHAQALGDVALHLRAQHQFGLQFGDLGLDLEVVVADQRLDPVQLGGLADLAARIRGCRCPGRRPGSPARWRDARGGHRMRGVAEHEHTLAGEVGRIDRAAVPGLAREVSRSSAACGSRPASVRHLGDELARGACRSARRG
jgi:hypothetical protein